MSILCSISVIHVLPRTIRSIIFDSKLTFQPFTLQVSVWFFKPFLVYSLSLQELGSYNTAFLDLFTTLLSLIFYSPQLKAVKNCRNYNASGTFTYYFISSKRKQFFFTYLRYYGLSLLRTLNLPPEGVRNNGSRLYIVFSFSGKLFFKKRSFFSRLVCFDR